MKYTVDARNLRHALSRLTRVVGKSKSTLPVLSHVLFEVEKKASRLRATNLDVHLEVDVPIKNGKPFSAAVPYKELKAAVPAKRDDVVTLQPQKGGKFLFQVNRYVIEGMATEEFPSRPERVKATLKTQVKAGLLEAALMGVLPATSSDITRPGLNGVCLDLDENHIVATDGHRLHAMPFGFGLKNKSRKFGTRTLPPVAVETLIHCLDDPEATVEIAFESDTTVRFSAGGFTLWTNLIEGSYPNWQQVIDRKKKKPDVELPRADLIEHIRSVLKLGKDNHLTMVEHDRRVDVSLIRKEGQPPTAGRGFPVKGKLPRNAVISFNPRYLLDAFDSFTGDLVQMTYSDALSPCVFADSDSGLRIVVMPVRTNDKKYRVIGDRIVEGQRDPKAKNQEAVTTPATAGREEAVSKRKRKGKGKEVLQRKPFEGKTKRELKAALKEKQESTKKIARAIPTAKRAKSTITPEKVKATLNPTFALEGQIVQFENETFTLDQIRIRLKDMDGKIRGGRSARAFLEGLTIKKAKPRRKK